MKAEKSATIQTAESEDRRLLALFSIAVPLAIYLFIRLRSIAEPGDDALMTLRGVRNLVEGLGFLYNPGHPVLSSTTPLYAIYLALVSKLFQLDPAAAAPYALLPFELLNIVLIHFLTRRITSSLAAAAAASTLYALSRYSMLAALLCMEAPLFNSLLLSAVCCLSAARGRRFELFGLALTGATAICRPEGALFILLVVFQRQLALLPGTTRRRMLPVSEIAALSVFLLPWLVYATLSFGSPIPQSVFAKRAAYLPIPRQSLGWMLDYLSALLDWNGANAPANFGLLAANLLLVAVGVAAIARRCSAALLLPLFSLGLWLAYVLANQFMFPWYLAPLDPGFSISAIIGLWALCSGELFRRGAQPARPRLGPAVFAAAAVVLLAFRLGWFDGTRCSGSGEALHCFPAVLTFPHADVGPQAGRIFSREGLYRRIAADLAPEVSAQTTILTPEFGVLGYFLPARIISSAAHVNPEVMPYLPPPAAEVDFPRINNAVTIEMVRGLNPDYVISPEIFIRKSLLVDERFKSEYDELRRENLEFGEYGPVYIFRRKGIGL